MKKIKPIIVSNPELIDDILNEEAKIINEILTECSDTASEVMEDLNTNDPEITTIETDDEDNAEIINEVLNTTTLTE